VKKTTDRDFFNNEKYEKRRNFLEFVALTDEIADDHHTQSQNSTRKVHSPHSSPLIAPFSPMSISAYIFDLDGTLIDSEGIWARCIFLALEAAGAKVTFPEIRFLEFGQSWSELFLEIQSRWPGCYACRQEMESWMAPVFRRLSEGMDLSIPGSKGLLLRLIREQYPVTIVSGSTRLQVQQAIRRLGVDEYIRFFVCCEDVRAGKPNPEGFLKGAELLQTEPARCLVFEDKYAGVLAAKAAGMRCVLLQRPDAIPQKTSGADLVLNDLADFNPDSLIF